MRGLISRQRPSALSRRLSYIGSVPDHARAGRGLGHFVSSVAQGVADFSHAVGKGAAQLVNKLAEYLENAVNPSHAGQDSGSGTATGAETRQEPHSTVDPVSGGPSSQTSRSVSPPDPSSTSHSFQYTTVSPTPAPWTSASQDDGAAHAGSHHSYGPSPHDAMHLSASTNLQYSETGNGVTLAPSSTALTTQSLTRTMELPSNSSGASAAHRKGFPLAAAAALGAVLGFLVVSALLWVVWLYLRRRRRASRAVYLPPKRMLSVKSARTVSTVPLFISASEAGVKDENPFKHPLDADKDEGDPFDAASLWRSSTTRSVLTLSV